MKFALNLKMPDISFYALQDIKDESSRAEAKELMDQFVKWDEYVTIEFDTEQGTATVCKVKRNG
jgi:hypothetical protein